MERANQKCFPNKFLKVAIIFKNELLFFSFLFFTILTETKFSLRRYVFQCDSPLKEEKSIWKNIFAEPKEIVEIESQEDLRFLRIY